MSDEPTLEEVATWFCEAVGAAAQHNRRGTGGQQVQFSGDWAHVVPSTIKALEYWANRMKAAMANPADRKTARGKS